MRNFKESMLTPILLIVVFGLVLCVNFLPDGELGRDENPYLAVIIVQLLIYGLPCMFYYTVRGREGKATLVLVLEEKGWRFDGPAY